MIIYFINIIHECELFKLPWLNCHNIVCTASNENSPPTHPRSIYCTSCNENTTWAHYKKMDSVNTNNHQIIRCTLYNAY